MHPAHPWFIFLFCLGNFFQNFGPNVTTFVVPAEVFPTRYRTTAYGITAACGKLGAIISQLMVTTLENRGGPQAWIQHLWALVLCHIGDDAKETCSFPIYALFMLSGLLSTFLIPETNGVALEDISAEDGRSSEDSVDGTTMARLGSSGPSAELPRFRNRSYGTSSHSMA
jgi:PHS family inorganic phosphate transporter-like MFS transporter